jgi:Fe-S-cluster containining protein
MDSSDCAVCCSSSTESACAAGPLVKKPPTRCCSLEGTVGQATRCSIYEQRSSVCREFESSWSQGVQNVDCDAARAAFGLAPLQAPPVELELPISA